MCGIMGMINGHDVVPDLVDGLGRLAYRGYDSAGVAIVSDGAIARRRAAGKLANLKTLLTHDPIAGGVGIAHTRWATHGGPSADNAHPHANGRVAVVHNGIIENFRELREELAAAGHVFTSETDTEVIPHLIADFLDKGMEPDEATAAAIRRLEGCFALGVILLRTSWRWRRFPARSFFSRTMTSRSSVAPVLKFEIAWAAAPIVPRA